MWFTSDLHLGHKKIIEFEDARKRFDTIEEHDEYIIDSYNATVGISDKVYILGDILFGRDITKVQRLNGRKRLILGNHDKEVEQWHFKIFEKIYGCKKLETHGFKFILTHIPVNPNQFPRFDLNIHGHMHSELVKNDNPFLDSKYYNVALERHELKPVHLDNVLEYVRLI